MTITDCEKQMDKIPGKPARLCKKKQVLLAINVLRELNKKFLEGEAKKQPLLDEATECPILLQVSMKKIPSKKLVKRIKVPLPYPMVTDTTEVCLFTGDLDKRNKKAEIDPDVLHYKELLKEQGITKVTEVIPLRQLRTEYKVYEARRQLMGAYDVFLSDKKITQCLPKLLGKSFFKKRKFPIQIDMNTSNLKSQIEKALSATMFSVNCRGNSCTSEVAHLGMDDKEIFENVLASVKVLADKLPGEQNNIFGIYIKTPRSQAIPIFISFGNPSEVKFQKPFNRENLELEELSTLPNAEVKVFRDGRIVVRETLADSDDEDTSEVFNEIKPRRGKRKGMDAEAVDEDIIEDNLEVKSRSEFVVEDAEGGISPSKTRLKKKRKTSVKKEAQEEKESNELEVEDTEDDISASKTKLKKKSGKANVKKKAQEDTKAVDEDIIGGNLEVKSRSESMVEDAEEGISPRKTKLKKKRKNSVKKEVQEEKESHESVVEDAEEGISPLKTKLKKKRKTSVKKEAQEEKESNEFAVKDVEKDISASKTKLKNKRDKANIEKEVQEGSSEVTEIYLKAEVEDIEEDTSASKTKLKNKRGKANIKTKIQEGETKNTRKRKSVNTVEDFNTSTDQLKLKKKNTTDIEIVEPVRVLRKTQPKVRSTSNGHGDKRILRQRL